MEREREMGRGGQKEGRRECVRWREKERSGGGRGKKAGGRV